jgi:Flp pilus assembly pilin Flp
MLTLIQSLLPALVQRVRGEEGQTFLEYALVIGGISIVLLAAFAGLSGALSGYVDDITTALGG